MVEVRLHIFKFQWQVTEYIPEAHGLRGKKSGNMFLYASPNKDIRSNYNFFVAKQTANCQVHLGSPPPSAPST